MKANKILIGIISREDYMKRTIAIAKGEYKPKHNEPKIWFESIQSIAKIFSTENQELLRIIIQQQPESITALANLTGKKTSYLSKILETMAHYGIIELDKTGLKPTVKSTDFKIEFSLNSYF